MQHWLHRIQTVDRRWIYLILILSLVVSLRFAKPASPAANQFTKDLYDVVAAAPAGPDDGKIILVGLTFSPSTLAESGNQARALLRHLILEKKRFAVMSVGEFNGAILGTAMAKEITEQYGYRYGEDWISFGFQPNVTAFYTGFPRDIPGTVKKDAVQGKPVESFPIMQGIKEIDDVALFVDITASTSTMNWITLVQGRYPLKIGYACTGVMVAEAYPFLDSGQMSGMMPGLRGAADYETMVDAREAQLKDAGELQQGYDPSKQQAVTITSARTLMFTQNWAHVVIILFIVIGNVGMLLARRAARSKENV